MPTPIHPNPCISPKPSFCHYENSLHPPSTIKVGGGARGVGRGHLHGTWRPPPLLELQCSLGSHNQASPTQRACFSSLKWSTRVSRSLQHYQFRKEVAVTGKPIYRCFQQSSNSHELCEGVDDGKDQERKRNENEFLLSLYRVVRTLPLLFLAGAAAYLQFPALADSERCLAEAGTTSAVKAIRPSELLTSGWAGMMAGCLHALTGPDHLAALAPLCIGRAKLESAFVGALWGCGHDTGQMLFGLAFLLLKDKLHIELVRTWAARVVGVTLLTIGALGIKEAQEVPVSVLAGPGGSSAESGEPVDGRNSRRLRTFATGLVYGLQPDALIMILPALALPSRLAGAAYLGMFLIGTVIAMGSYTAFIGSCGEALQKRLPWITHRLSICSSLIAIAFGLGVLIGEFFGVSLF